MSADAPATAASAAVAVPSTHRKARLDATHWTSRTGLAFIASGFALRLAELLGGRPIWTDEALLLLNVFSRPLDGFFRPLDGGQFAPLGFLWAEWLVTRLCGTGEVALRAIPFAAGVAALIGFARLARRLLDPGAALVATALAALSPLLIHYSAEVKSYELDALMAILLMHATVDIAEKGATRHTQLRWAIAAAVAALVSTPAPFAIGGCALALLAVPRLRRDGGALLRVTTACAPAAAIYVLQLLTVYSSSQAMSHMQQYWATSFLEPQFTRAIGGLAHAVRELWVAMLFRTESFLPPKTPTALLVLAVAGIVSNARRDRFGVALLLVPIALATCASLAQRWPLTPRLLLFVAPAMFTTVAAGLATVAHLVPARARVPAMMALATALISATAIGSASELRNPTAYYAVPEALADIGTHLGKNAIVYMSPMLVPPCAYYSSWRSGLTRPVGDSAARGCSIRGARMVLGKWVVRDDRMGARLNADGERPISAEWVTTESSRILSAASGEVWFVGTKSSFEGTDLLRSAIERTGAVRVAVRWLPGISIYRYSVRSHVESN